MLSVRIPWVRTENPLFSTRCLNADVGQHGAIVCIPATGIPNSRNAPADAGEISITIAMSRRVSMRHGFVGQAGFSGSEVLAGKSRNAWRSFGAKTSVPMVRPRSLRVVPRSAGFRRMVMSLAPFQGNAVNLNIFIIQSFNPVFH